MSKRRVAAHFLLVPELAYSPPNDAIVRALLELDYEVELFAPGGNFDTSLYGPRVSAHQAEYGKRWLLRQALSPRWRKYALFSGTSEDPLAVVGVLSWLHRKPSFVLADEIKSGGYRGNASESWKRLCRWGMRRARFNIVNDVSRIELQREYAGIGPQGKILVYPGCYNQTPPAGDRAALRSSWGIPQNALVLGVSGAFNETVGAEWLLKALQDMPDIHAAVHPLGINSFTEFLLRQVKGSERLYLAQDRLGWHEAWSSAVAFDIGLAVYLNPAPQFQNMGTSSNRLCMLLSMGIPIIANRQPSFEFLVDYDCGVLVESFEEFKSAITKISNNLDVMKKNAIRCAREYIGANQRYIALGEELGKVHA